METDFETQAPKHKLDTENRVDMIKEDELETRKAPPSEDEIFLSDLLPPDPGTRRRAFSALLRTIVNSGSTK